MCIGSGCGTSQEQNLLSNLRVDSQFSVGYTHAMRPLFLKRFSICFASKLIHHPRSSWLVKVLSKALRIRKGSVRGRRFDESLYHQIRNCLPALTVCELARPSVFGSPLPNSSCSSLACNPHGVPHSTKFLNFVISSNKSCKSSSLILFAKLGINVFASSALSQHRLPSPSEYFSPPLALKSSIQLVWERARRT